MKLTRNDDGTFEKSKEVKASCWNCRFVYCDSNDIWESAKCALAGRYNKHPTNPDAEKALEESGLDFNGYCEHHTADDVISDREVVY